MVTVTKLEEILPKDFDKLKETGSTLHTVIMFQAVTSILIEKNIMRPEEINERAKQLYEIQRKMMVTELNK
jgi:hypothetical protein